jgi:hypothetical protein
LFGPYPFRITLLLILVCVFSAEARVFNYKEASKAAYLRGTGALSRVGQSAFENSSGTDTELKGESTYAYSGELGFVFGVGSMTNIRLGAEMIQHRPVDGKGLNPAGEERFALDSSVVVFNPNVTLEFIYKTQDNLRFFVFTGLGFADVTVDNRYTMTATGSTELGVADFSEKLTGSTYSGHAGIGLEARFVDNVTFSCDFGYRYLPVRTLKYKGDVNNIVAPGGAAKGDEALNHDGHKRSLDLSGISAGITFRFYLQFL